MLSAWIDFNDDGDWADAGEQIFRDQLLVAGTNNLTYPVGAGAVVTAQTFARFRLSSQAGLWYSGQAPDGEVEDFQVAIVAGIPSFVVTNTTPTTTGVVLTFNRDLDATPLNLYNGSSGELGPADLTLVGATTGNVRGSLVIEANPRQATFVMTTGILQPDVYTLSLRSAANGFRDSNGVLLDGNVDGTAGGDFTTTFTIDPPVSSAVTISLPNFARGPQQSINVPAPTITGIPLSFSAGAGITSAAFHLNYDPALLTISSAAVAPGLPPGANVVLDTSVTGVAAIQFTSPSPLAAGTTRFIELQASVPATAPYRSKQVLEIDNIAITPASISALGDNAVQVVAYFGDLTSNGSYSGQDATYLTRLAVGAVNGVTAFKLLDPTIIADITGTAGISSSDTSRVLQRSVGLTVPEIPPLPLPAISLLSGGPDPKLSIPQDLVAQSGAEVAIPVMIDSIVDLTGNGLESADLVIFFDSDVLDVRSVSLGSLLEDQGGWFVSARIDATAGRMDIAVGGQHSLAGSFLGELVQIQAVVKEGTMARTSAINLAASAREPSRFTQLNEGYLTLIPAPTDGAHDSIDGRLTIIAQQSADADLPSASQAGNQLVIAGTSSDDRILIGAVGTNQIRVRVGNQLLGPFAMPASIAINTRGGQDQVVIAPELSGDGSTRVQELQDQALLQLLATWETSSDDKTLDTSARRRR